VPIEMKVDGSHSSFKVASVLEVQFAPNTEHELMVNLPKGFIFQTAHAVELRS
jgi:hypothetical protein